jgi:hypothetical protein
MAWNYDNSKARVERIANDIGEVEITDLTKQMDLGNVKLRQPKRIRGAHLYVEPTNQKQLVDERLDLDDPASARRVARQLHFHEREAGRILRDFGLDQIHFQGARLHALGYRPVGDAAEVIARTVLGAAAIDLAARRALTEILPKDPRITCVAGAAYGPTLATMSGPRAESELLFIGDAANQGAKILSAESRLRVDQDFLDLLDAERFGITVTDLADGTYRLGIEPEDLEEAAKRLGNGWTLERSRKQLAADAEKLPLDAFSVVKATSTIDKDRLGVSNSKLNDAVTAFGDLDGFTALVREAKDDAERAELVRAFHIVRYELNYVRKDDYPKTFRVQFQGDRIQVLRHLPHDDTDARGLKTLKVAAGWQSSITKTLPEVLGRDDLHLAIGLAADCTLVSKLGTTGSRDVLALGAGVRRAERIQRNIDADETGIDAAIRDTLPEAVAELFEWRPGPQGYIARDLDVNKLEDALRSESLAAGEVQSVTQNGGKYVVGAAALATGALATAALARKARPRTDDVAPRRRWAR